MQSPSVNFRNADRTAGGRLASLLVRWADEGLSYAGIQARLMAEHQVEVSRPTVGVWLDYARAVTAAEVEMDAAS